MDLWMRVRIALNAQRSDKSLRNWALGDAAFGDVDLLDTSCPHTSIIGPAGKRYWNITNNIT